MAFLSTIQGYALYMLGMIHLIFVEEVGNLKGAHDLIL